MKAIIPEDEWDDFVMAMSQTPSVSVRLNPSKKSILPFDVGPSIPWESDGYYIDERPVFTLDPLIHAGAYYVQEASSMMIGSLMDIMYPGKKPSIVLDMSAAPGGKSTQILSKLPMTTLVVSNEPVGSRFNILQDNLTRWGRSNLAMTKHYPKAFEALPDFFDFILVDAPCSGEGMMRKDEQAITHWSEKNIAQCYSRQIDILQSATRCLSPGGILLYSTCTFNREENDTIGDELISSGIYEKMAVSISQNWPLQRRDGKHTSVYIAYPHKVRGEGFAFQVFRKKGSSPPGKQKLNKSKLSFSKSPEFLQHLNCNVYKSPDGNLFTWNPSFQPYFTDLLFHLEQIQPGLKLGISKGKDFIPDHALALSIEYADRFPHIDLDREQALQYLRGESEIFGIPPAKGWIKVNYQGLSIGWMKGLGNRFNNYYPKPMRIRMK